MANSMPNTGAVTAAAVARAAGEAIKTCGPIITLGSQSFYDLVRTLVDPLVVTSQTGLFGKMHHYVTTWRGLTFYARSKTALPLQDKATLLEAERITVPEL